MRDRETASSKLSIGSNEYESCIYVTTHLSGCTFTGFKKNIAPHCYFQACQAFISRTARRLQITLVHFFTLHFCHYFKQKHASHFRPKHADFS